MTSWSAYRQVELGALKHVQLDAEPAQLDAELEGGARGRTAGGGGNGLDACGRGRRPLTEVLVDGAGKAAGAGVVAFMLVMMALTFSSALVGGDELLATRESAFISMSLLSLCSGMAMHVRRSTIPFVTAGPYTSLAPLLSSVAHGFATQCAPDAWLPTTIVCFSLMSIFTGGVLCVLAHPRVRLGKAAAYLPAPVLMGMMIAIAVTIVISALQVAAGFVVFQTSPLGPLLYRPPPSDAAVLRRAAAQCACAIVVGVSLFCTRYVRRSLAIRLTPTILLVSIVAFHAAARLGGVRDDVLRESKWLGRKLVLAGPLDAFASSAALLSGLAHGRVDWIALLDLRTSPLQALPVYCCVDLLLVVGMLPAFLVLPAPADRKGVDADKELATAGISAIAQGMLGVPSAAYMISTSMQHRDLSGGRESGWLITAMCAGCLLLGPALASTVPRFVLGGLFVSFALSFAKAASMIAMTRADRAVLAATAVTYVGLGAMAGLMIGLVFTCLHFVVEQSYIDVTSLVESTDEQNVTAALGSSRRSSCTRGDAGATAADASVGERGAARDRDAVSIVLSLKGILFFATTHALTAEILRQVDAHGPVPSGLLVLNFAHVQSVDVSAIHTLKKLADELEPRRWALRCTGLRSRLASRFAQIGLTVITSSSAAGAAKPVEPQAAGAADGCAGARVASPAPTRQPSIAPRGAADQPATPPRAALDGAPALNAQSSCAAFGASMTLYPQRADAPPVDAPSAPPPQQQQPPPPPFSRRASVGLFTPLREMGPGSVVLLPALDGSAPMPAPPVHRPSSMEVVPLCEALADADGSTAGRADGAPTTPLAWLRRSGSRFGQSSPVIPAIETLAPTQPADAPSSPLLGGACPAAPDGEGERNGGGGGCNGGGGGCNGGGGGCNGGGGGCNGGGGGCNGGGGGCNGGVAPSCACDCAATGASHLAGGANAGGGSGGALRYALCNDSLDCLAGGASHPAGVASGGGSGGALRYALCNDSLDCLAGGASHPAGVASGGGSAECVSGDEHACGQHPVGGFDGSVRTPSFRMASVSEVPELRTAVSCSSYAVDAPSPFGPATVGAIGRGGAAAAVPAAAATALPAAGSASAQPPGTHGARPAGKAVLIPDDLSQFSGVFRAYGRPERVCAQAEILSASADGAPSSELVFVERGDALLWLSRKALGGEVKSNESLATLRTHGTLIGCTEVLLAIPRPFDARMLTDGEIVRLSLDELLQIRADRPDVWEALLLKSMQGQNTTASEALFSVEG
ncbi:hypothetical protein KFE25_003597 [Diacronema lutheri]|uniref:STAS domain-containing protein n=1 Tax=Diacronema lutheri TaxID=2081491 RepID=A0A8J5X7E1_DIALT|nr:hypothetical protein KFE25_003597 [Diacronema lutheri]